MKKLLVLALAVLALAGCAPKDSRTHITLQRFFGECRANVPKGKPPLRNPDGECEVITRLLDQFRQQNPDIDLSVNIVAWPGYDQLSAEYAAGDPPDIAIMHQSAMPDYQKRGLIAPLDADFRQAGIDPADPRVSPLLAESLSGLAPALIAVAGFDPLRDEGERYATALQAAGTPVDLRCLGSLTHGFASLFQLGGGSAAATSDLISALRAHLSRA